DAGGPVEVRHADLQPVARVPGPTRDGLARGGNRPQLGRRGAAHHPRLGREAGREPAHPGPVGGTEMATAPAAAAATKTAPKAAAAPKLPVWVWEGKTKSGEVKKGEVEAPDEASVQQRLRAMALTNVKIKKKPIQITLKLPGFGGIGQKDIVI